LIIGGKRRGGKKEGRDFPCSVLGHPMPKKKKRKRKKRRGEKIIWHNPLSSLGRKPKDRAEEKQKGRERKKTDPSSVSVMSICPREDMQEKKKREEGKKKKKKKRGEKVVVSNTKDFPSPNRGKRGRKKERGGKKPAIYRPSIRAGKVRKEKKEVEERKRGGGAVRIGASVAGKGRKRGGRGEREGKKRKDADGPYLELPPNGRRGERKRKEGKRRKEGNFFFHLTPLRQRGKGKGRKEEERRKRLHLLTLLPVRQKGR